MSLDDCWARSRDPVTGVIQPDPKAFPDGMKKVADYVHSKGLLFGIYTDRGEKTCVGRPGSFGYEKLDAETYASWGVSKKTKTKIKTKFPPSPMCRIYETLRKYRSVHYLRVMRRINQTQTSFLQ